MERVGVAGDWHGNIPWAVHAVTSMGRRLEGEESKLILHAGDFGVWPGEGGKRYLRELDSALHDAEASLWFVDGNHEDFTQLKAAQRRLARRLALSGDTRTDRDLPVPLGERIFWLPRGTRWDWHGRTWLALGGAVSVDRAIRREGVDWWPDEVVTPEEEEAVKAAGAADVVLAHDAPDYVGLRLMPREVTAAWGWAQEDIWRSEDHRRLMTRVAEAVRPSHWIHGHYHQGTAAWRVEEAPWGETRVASLDCDGNPGVNWGILNVRAMDWE